jgi:hypothetical protein
MYAADLGGIENSDSLGIKNTVRLKFRVHGVPIWINDPFLKCIHFEAAIIVRCLFEGLGNQLGKFLGSRVPHVNRQVETNLRTNSDAVLISAGHFSHLDST